MSHNPTGATEKVIREHLERILASEMFVRSERLGKFLRFVTEETLAGRGDELKEYAIGVLVYGRRDFDPRLDSSVRVDARRLRLKLEEFYAGPGADSGVRIEIPKGGYLAAFQTTEAAEPPPAPVPTSRRWLVAGAVAATAAAAIFAAFSLREERVTVLAVVPFTNLTGDVEMDSTCVGLAVELRHRASRIGKMRVIAGSIGAVGVRDVWKTARDLGVDELISGSVRASGNRIRVSAQMVRVRDRGMEWSETLDLERGDPLVMQARLGEVMERRLRGGESAGPDPEGQTAKELEAQLERVAFLSGRRARGALEKAVAEAQAVLEKFPRNARAKALEADATMMLADYLVGPEGGRMLDRSRRLAEEALDLDGGLAIPHSTLGLLKMRYEWKWAEAESLLRRAVWLQPDSAVAQVRLARLLSALGNQEEARQLAESARLKAPLQAQVVAMAGHVAYYGGRFQDAVQLLEQALDLDPAYIGLRITRVRALSLAGEEERALVEYARLPAEMRKGVEFRALESWLLARAGKMAEARAAGAGIERATPISSAGSWFAMGERDRALETLRKGVLARNASMEFLKVSPVIDGLRAEPAMEEICAIAGLSGCLRAGAR